MQQIDPCQLSPQQQKAYEEYKRRVAEKARLEEAEREKRQTEQLEKQAFWSQKWSEKQAEEAEVHVATRDLKTPCKKCAGKIHKGEGYNRLTEPVGFGYPEGYHYVTHVRHAPECPSEVKTP